MSNFFSVCHILSSICKLLFLFVISLCSLQALSVNAYAKSLILAESSFARGTDKSWNLPNALNSRLSIKEITGEIPIYRGTGEDVLTIMQAEYVVLKRGKTDFLWISSNDATSCVLAMFRTQDGKVISYAHFDVSSDVKPTVQKIVMQMQEVSSSKIDVVLGGLHSDHGLLLRVDSALASFGIFPSYFVRARSMAISFDGVLTYNTVYSETLGEIKLRWKNVERYFQDVKNRWERLSKECGCSPANEDLRMSLKNVNLKDDL